VTMFARRLRALTILIIGCLPFEEAGADELRSVQAILETQGPLVQSNVRVLVAADTEVHGRLDEQTRRFRTRILNRLGESGTSSAVEYVRSVFESDVEFRDEAAVALSRFALNHRRLHADWQLLVRSLAVVEGSQAAEVIRALSQFRDRATNPVWIRWVILRALEFEPENQEMADNLLSHWAGIETPTGVDRIPAWQQWFHETHPDQPPAVQPPPHSSGRWDLATLRTEFEAADFTQADRALGAAIYRSAQCVNCHRFREQGVQAGPELTRVAGRLQRKQILEAVLFPSQHLNDEYPCGTALLVDGRLITGTIRRGLDSVEIVELNGRRHTVDKSAIEEVAILPQSGMPAGLLDDLSRDEIAALLAYVLLPPDE